MYYAFGSQQQKLREERVYIFSVETMHSLECLSNIASGLIDLGIAPDQVHGNIPRKIFRVAVPVLSTIGAVEIISALEKIGMNAQQVDLSTTAQSSISSTNRKRKRIS